MVDVVSLHAAFEQTKNVTVVRVLSETKASTVVHELFEFIRLVFAQVINRCFFLLFLNLGIFLSLGSSG